MDHSSEIEIVEDVAENREIQLNCLNGVSPQVEENCNNGNSMESQVIPGLRLDATTGRMFYAQKYEDSEQFYEDHEQLISETLRNNNTLAFMSLCLAAPHYFWVGSYLEEALEVSNLATCMVVLTAYKKYLLSDDRNQEFTGLQIQQLTSQNPDPEVAKYFQQLIPIGSQMGVLSMRRKLYIYVIPEQYLEILDEYPNVNGGWEYCIPLGRLTWMQSDWQLRVYECHFNTRMDKYPETFEREHLTPITAQITNVTWSSFF